MSMRAMVLERQAGGGTPTLRLRQVPLPAPTAGEVRLRVHACGVCHTDLHLLRGELPLHRSPVVPGHQIVGVVDAVGADVATEVRGRRVGVTWLAAACGACEVCGRGLENLCARARFTGWDIDGGFAEAVVVPVDAVHALPDAINDAQAAPLLCAGVIGYRSLRLAGASAGMRLGLFGFGASAHLTLQVARHLGCEVCVFTRSAAHRELARELGAAWTGQAGDEPPWRLDCAITFAPAGWVVREALRVLAPGGTLAINAIHMSPIPELDYAAHLYGERCLRSVTNLTRADAREFLELAGRLRPHTVVEEFPLDAAGEALARMAAGTLRAAAVLIL